MLFLWCRLLMSLSSVVCVETVTEINAHYYIRFHSQLMNYLVQNILFPWWFVCVCLSHVNI